MKSNEAIKILSKSFEELKNKANDKEIEMIDVFFNQYSEALLSEDHIYDDFMIAASCAFGQFQRLYKSENEILDSTWLVIDIRNIETDESRPEFDPDFL